MSLVKRVGLAVGIALAWPAVTLAQTAQPTGSWAIFESDFLVLFRILVVATVIERLLEVVSLGWGASARWLRTPSATGSVVAHRSGNDVAKIRKQLILQSLGILIGIAICWRAGLGLFAELHGVASGHLGEIVTGWLSSRAGTALDFIATGFLVGLGTEPVHSIIVIILRRWDLRRAQVARAH